MNFPKPSFSGSLGTTKDRIPLLKEQIYYKKSGRAKWMGILELYENKLVLKPSAPYIRLVGIGIGSGETIFFDRIARINGAPKLGVVPKSEFEIETSDGMKWVITGSPSLYSAVERQYESWKKR